MLMIRLNVIRLNPNDSVDPRLSLTHELISAEMASVANEHLFLLVEGQAEVVAHDGHGVLDEGGRDSVVLDVEGAQLCQRGAHVVQELWASGGAEVVL